MDHRWEMLLERILSKENEAPSWKSDQLSLTGIIEWANRMAIDPSDVISIDITKLRTIIKEAKRAINRDNPERLTQLFDWAKTDTVINLRQKVGITIPEDVDVQAFAEDDKVWYVIKFSADQLERNAASTKPHFRFVMPAHFTYRRIQ